VAAHLQFYPFHGSILGSIHIWGHFGPALTAHGSLDLKQEIQIQIALEAWPAVRGILTCSAQ
jgi:hypothetical protein